MAAYKSELVNEYTHSLVGLSFDELRKSSQSVPEALYFQIFETITKINIGCSLILVNLKYKTPFVFQVSEEGLVDQVRNSCASGSGAPNAESWLHYRKLHQFSSLSEAIVSVYEAKKFAEHAPGVGEKTRLVVIGPSDRVRILDTPGQRVLDAIWETHGPREHPSEFIAIDDAENYLETDWANLTGE